MIQRRLAAQILKCSPHRIRFDTERLSDIKEAITNTDVQSLIKQGAITRLKIQGHSNARRKQRAKQVAKGRLRGHGKRKGRANARANTKDAWISRIRIQRALLFRLRERNKITDENFRALYNKAKGGFFRSERHVKIYCEEQNLFLK
jgi:large subunit ribosomal protein L19e